MKSIFSILFIATFFSAQAQIKPAQSATSNDPKAKIILDGMSKKYRSFKTIKANFKMVLENATSKNKEEKTGMLVLKGSKYHVEMGNIEISCDNKTIWTYTKEENELTINNFEPNAKGISPADIFTLYEKGFAYQLAEKVKENGKDLQVIELTPTDKSKNYFKIKLFVDNASQSIVRSKIFDKNGNRYTYEIAQFASNTPFEETYFSFDAKKHPNVEITDNRN